MALELELAPQLRVVAVGHVDHGKSTLIGRLLHDTGNLPEGKVAELQRVSERRGAAFEWSFVLDALQSERDQAVTIDTTRIWMRLPGREIVLIDAPGHKEFLRNMVTGASDADAALLLVDAHDGVSEQTRRHSLLLELIGVERVVVAINKMDRVEYAAARYTAIRAELTGLLERVGITPAAFVPTCARDGENVAGPAPSMPWYDGPTVLDALLALPAAAGRSDGEELRLAVQGVVRRDLQRFVVGRIESGSIAVGQQVVLSPSRRSARIASLEAWPPNGRVTARAGESVGFTLDAPLFVDRGDVVSDALHPPALATAFRARLLWLGQRPLAVGDAFRLHLGTRSAQVNVTAFERVIELESLDRADEKQRASTNDVAEAIFTSPEVLALDTVSRHRGLARFILLDGIDIVAGGTVLAALGGAAQARAADVVPVGHLIGTEARARRNRHRGAVLWFTGLPAAGKSTLAMQVERRLFELGYNAYVLDGDNIRGGLCSDLGFAAEDRHENVRRVGEVAALFADAGTIAIAAFISPYRADRALARRAAGGAFHEIYIKADPEVCERRDPKGHYRKARAGELDGFTGVNGDYEEPLEPDLCVDTTSLSVDEAVEAILRYVDDRLPV
ncbi:MAG: adenylyl-sulfate kinase [Candidatus Baltobacteraceae bacterium]|jgi:bifunctional enzyme CysN/CysC